MTVVSRPVLRQVVTQEPTERVVVATPPAQRVLVAAPGPQGPPGESGTSYSHEQTVPAATWILRHDMGRTPGVTLVVDGRVVFTDIAYPDLNTVTITWPVPTVGRAELY